jgi:TolB protein
MKPLPRLLAATLVLATLQLSSFAADDAIVIERHATGEHRIPIALAGYDGEVKAVLTYDLEIVGFDVVAEGQKHQHSLKGSNAGRVEGRLIDEVNKSQLLGVAYSNGSLRTQAHALADAVIEKLTGRKGLGQTKIAYRQWTGGGNSEICIADFDGGGAKQITFDKTIARDPAWQPGGGKLYYTSYMLNNPDIFSHDLQTGARQKVARYSGSNIGAALSPNGRRVAMILSKGGSMDVYVADADGGNLKQLTRTREDESSPCWSPDGKTLCFTSNMDGRTALYTIPAEGGTPTRLRTTGVAGKLTEPDWSPDGKLIAFTLQRGGFEIATVPAGGGEVKVIVAGEDPSWAPNSRTLIFSSRRGDRRVLSLLDVPTKQVKDVRQISGSCSQPSWSR